MHKILVITIYFPSDALNVSDCISPSSGANFKLYITFGICRHHTCGSCVTSHTYGADIYQMRCTAYKVAPDDGLI